MTVLTYDEQGRLAEEYGGNWRDVYDAQGDLRVRFGERPIDLPPPAMEIAVPKDQRERAARALCRKDGHPENITFEGKPMWMSYLDTVDIVMAELDGGFDPLGPLMAMPEAQRRRIVEGSIRADKISVADISEAPPALFQIVTVKKP